MLSRDYRDILGGLILLVAGVSFTTYAFLTLDLGTPRQMGPGLFPAGLGIVMALLGIFISILALSRTGSAIEISFVRPTLILASVAAFAIIIPIFGMVPAIVVVTLVSSMADRHASLLQLLARLARRVLKPDGFLRQLQISGKFQRFARSWIKPT